MSDTPHETSNDWVTVRTCLFGHEADLIRSVLEGSGIEVFIPDERMGTLQPLVLLKTGVRVQVRASDVERASELLDELEKDAPGGDDGQP